MEYDGPIFSRKISYAFQPIFNIKTMTIVGYEALIRPEGCNPLAFIEEAIAAGESHRIECFTFFKSMECFLKANLKGNIFINSLPNECLTLEELKLFRDTYSEEDRNRIIVEILEYPRGVLEKWLNKQQVLRQKGNLIALDDYGTFENFGDSVLELYCPNLIKIDRSIISGTDKSEEKYGKLKDMVINLKERGYLVLAEGIETAGELAVMKELEFDYGQGYYLGMPEIYSD